VRTKLAYTWGHSIDDASEPRNLLPANGYNVRLDRAASDFDPLHIFNAFASYTLPSFTSHWKPLTMFAGETVVQEPLWLHAAAATGKWYAFR